LRSKTAFLLRFGLFGLFGAVGQPVFRPGTAFWGGFGLTILFYHEFWRDARFFFKKVKIFWGGGVLACQAETGDRIPKFFKKVLHIL